MASTILTCACGGRFRCTDPPPGARARCPHCGDICSLDELARKAKAKPRRPRADADDEEEPRPARQRRAADSGSLTPVLVIGGVLILLTLVGAAGFVGMRILAKEQTAPPMASAAAPQSIPAPAVASAAAPEPEPPRRTPYYSVKPHPARPGDMVVTVHDTEVGELEVPLGTDRMQGLGTAGSPPGALPTMAPTPAAATPPPGTNPAPMPATGAVPAGGTPNVPGAPRPAPGFMPAPGTMPMVPGARAPQPGAMPMMPPATTAPQPGAMPMMPGAMPMMPGNATAAPIQGTTFGTMTKDSRTFQYEVKWTRTDGIVRVDSVTLDGEEVRSGAGERHPGQG